MTTYTPNKPQSNKRFRLGFTMMELMIVLAIMAILFAIAIPAVADIQKNLELARLDSYATDIYLAVENRLMAMKASGELLDLQGELYNNYATHNYTLVPDDYPDYTERYVDGSFRPQDWLRYTTEDNIIYENFFYLLHTPTGVSGGDAIVGTVVPAASTTEAVLGAYYVVEMNPTNGDLYGVFYSDKPITFESILALESRSRDERKTTMIGYYTKGYTDVLTRGEMDAFQVKLSFVNKEDLYLHIECDVRTAYFDRHEIEASVTFHDTKDPEGSQYDLIVPIDLTDPTIWGKSAGNYSTFSTDMLLDSLTSGKDFATVFGDASLAGFRNPVTYPQNKNCAGTFTPGDDIRATVNVHYSKAGRMMLTDTEHAAEFPTQLTQNSLFESNDGHGNIRVGYVRHLRNLSSYAYTGTEDVTITQSQNISFAPTYVGSDGVSRSIWEEDARVDGSMENPIAQFEPIYNTSLFAGTKTSTFDGQNNQLLYFSIAKANASAANTGLFARADGATIQNVILVDPTVTGADNTGALIGLAQGASIVNCGVRLDTIDPETNVYYPDMESRIGRFKVSAASGYKALGGLVGKATGSTHVVGSYAAVLVDGGDSVQTVGGLIGLFEGTNATASFIRESYSSEMQIGDQVVGGLVGSIQNASVEGCYAAGDVRCESYGGGLIGEIAGPGVTVTDSDAYGRVSRSNGYSIDKDYSRGFVGVSAYAASYTGCHYLKQAGYNDDAAFDADLPSGIVAREYEDLRVTPANNANTSHPYLMVNAIIFPFEMNTYYDTDDTSHTNPLTLHHYGDWPAEQSVQPSLVYYERYPDGHYSYYTMTSLASDLEHSNQWKLDTLRYGDGVYCVEDGYALMTVYHLTEYTYKLNDGAATRYAVGQNPALFERMEVLPFDYTDADGNVVYDGDEPEKERFELVYLYQLPFELQETGTNTQLYDKLEVTSAHAVGNGSLNVIPGYVFYYSPRFAMTAVNPTIEQSPVIELSARATPAATALGTTTGEGFATRDVNALSLALQNGTAVQAMAQTTSTAAADETVADVRDVLPGDGVDPVTQIRRVFDLWGRKTLATTEMDIQISVRNGRNTWMETLFGETEPAQLRLSQNGTGTPIVMTRDADVTGLYHATGLTAGANYTVSCRLASGAVKAVGVSTNGTVTPTTFQPGALRRINYEVLKLTAGAGVSAVLADGVEVESRADLPYVRGSSVRVNATVMDHFSFVHWRDTYDKSVWTTEQSFAVSLDEHYGSISMTAIAKMDVGSALLEITVAGHPDYIEAAFPDAQGLYLCSGASYYPMIRAGVKGTYTANSLLEGSVYTLYWKDSANQYHQIYNTNRDQIGDVPTLQAGQTLYTGFNFVRLYKDAGIDKLFINGQEVEAEKNYAFLHGFAYEPLGADGERNFPNQSIVRVTCTVKKGFMWHEWTWAEEGDGTLHDSWAHVREFSINVENGAWALKANTGAMDPNNVEYPTLSLNTLHVRSARQLNALGRYDFTWDWACEVEAFYQDIDIDFAHYTTTYCGHTLDLTPTAQSAAGNTFANVPIGNDRKLFQKRYDGAGHKIIDYCQLNEKDENVGLFGRVHGNTLTGIVMYASDPNAETPTAFVKSTKTSTLYADAEANDAYDYAPDGQPYMTFRNDECDLSVYWWGQETNELTRESYLQFLEYQGVNRIYLDIGAFQNLEYENGRQQAHAFTVAANAHGMEVMPMYSEADPVMSTPDVAQATIHRLVVGYQTYKSQYPTDRLEGYHMDILPHQEGGDTEFSTLTRTKLDHYANNFIRAAQEMRQAGIIVEINVNCEWISGGFGGENITYTDSTGTTTGIYNIVAKYTDRICTMPYADTMEQILNMLSDVLAAENIYHKPLILGFETGHYPQWNSAGAEFAQESKEYMYTSLARVYARLNELGYGQYIDGIAMHDHETWQDMESRRTITLESAVPNIGALVGAVCDVNNVSRSISLTKNATYTLRLSDAPSGTIPANTAYWGGLDTWTAPLQGAAQMNMKVTYSYADTGKEPPTSVTMNVYKDSSATPTLTVETTSFGGSSTAFSRGITLPIEGTRIEFTQVGGDENAVTATVTLSASTPTVISGCCASGYQVIRSSDATYNMTANLADIRIQPNVGGLIGYNLGTVDNCYAASRQVLIDEPSTYVYRSLGGLIGRNGGTVTDSYAGGELKYDPVSANGSLGNAQIGGVVGRGEGKTASVQSCYSTCTIADQSYYKKAGVSEATFDEPIVYAVADTTTNRVRKSSFLRGTYELAGTPVVYPVSDTLNLHDDNAFVKARTESQMKELLNTDVIGTHNGADKSLTLFCAESMKLVSSDYWVIIDVYGSFPGLSDPADAMLEMTGYRTYGTNAAVQMKALEASSSRIRFKVMGPLYMIGSNDFVVTIVGSEGVSRPADTRMVIQCGRYSQTQSTWDTKNGVSFTHWDESNGHSEIALYGSLFGDDTGSALKQNSHSYVRTQKTGYPYPAVVKTADGSFAHYGTWSDSHGAITSLSAKFNPTGYDDKFEIPTSYSWDSWQSFVSSLQASELNLHPGDYVELIIQPTYQNPKPSEFGVFKCEMSAMTGDTTRYQCVRYENGGTVTFEWVIDQETLLKKAPRLYFFADQSATGAQTRAFTLKSITLNIYRAGVEEEEYEYTGTVNVTRDGEPVSLAVAQPGAVGLALSQDGLNFLPMNPVDGATGSYTVPELVGVYNVFWVDAAGGYHQLGDYQLRNSTPLELGYYTLTLRAGSGVASVSINDGAVGATVSRVYLGGTGVTIHAVMQEEHNWGQWIRTGGAGYSTRQDAAVVVTGTMDLTAEESVGGDKTGTVQLKMSGSPYSADFIFDYDLGTGGLYLSADGEHYLLMTEDYAAGLYTCSQLESGKDYRIYWFDGTDYHLISLMHEKTVGDAPTVAAGETVELHFHGVTMSGDEGIDKLFVNGVEVANGSTTAVLGAFGAPNDCTGYSLVLVEATVKPGYEFVGWTDGSGHSASYSFTVDDGHGSSTRQATSRLVGSYTGTVYVELDGTRVPIGSAISGATGLAVSADGTTFTDMTTAQTGAYTVANRTGNYNLYYKVGSQYRALGTYQITGSTPITVSHYTVTLHGGDGVANVSVNGGGASAVVLTGSTATISATVADGYTWQRWVYTTGGALYSEDMTHAATVTGTLELTAQVTSNAQAEDELLAEWHANNNNNNNPSYVFGNGSVLQIRQYSSDYESVRTGKGYLTTDPSTNVTWLGFLQSHGNLAEGEYVVMTYSGQFSGISDSTTVTTFQQFGYQRNGTALTATDIDVLTLSDTTIQLRFNGPLTVDAAQNSFFMVLNGTTVNEDITNATTLVGQIYRAGTVTSSEPESSQSEPSQPEPSEPEPSEPESSEPTGEDVLLSKWTANNASHPGHPQSAEVKWSELNFIQSSTTYATTREGRGYLESDPSTSVSWLGFLQAHGDLKAGEYVLMTYETTGSFGVDPSNYTISKFENFGYEKSGADVTAVDIDVLTITDTKIQVRFNGPLTVDAAQEEFRLSLTPSTAASGSMTESVTMTGEIYRAGSGTPPTPVDDTIIYDADISATVNAPGALNLSDILTAFQTETAAHGVDEQYIVTITGSANPSEYIYPRIIGNNGTYAYSDNNFEHNYSLGTGGGTVYASIPGSWLTNAGETPHHLFFETENGATTLTITHVKIQVVRGETPPTPGTYTGTVNVTVNGAATAIGTAQSGATTLALSADNGAHYIDMTGSAGVYTATGLSAGTSYGVYWYDTAYHKIDGYTVSSATAVTVPYYTVTLRTGAGVTALSLGGSAVSSGTARTYLSGTSVQLNATLDTTHGYEWSAWTNTTGGTAVSTTKNAVITVSGQLDLTARATYKAAVIVQKNGTPGSFGEIYASAEGLRLRNTADPSDVKVLDYSIDTKTFTCSGLTPGSQYELTWLLDSTLTRIGTFVITDGSTLTVDYYTVTLTGGTGVTMTVNGEAATSGAAIPYLKGTISIGATAGEGYTWVGWYNTSGDTLYNANATVSNITLNAPLALTAKVKTPVVAQWTTTGGIGSMNYTKKTKTAVLTVSNSTAGRTTADGATATQTWTQFCAAHLPLANNQYMVVSFEGSFPGAANAATQTCKLGGYRLTTVANGSGNDIVLSSADSASNSAITYTFNGPLAANTSTSGNPNITCTLEQLTGQPSSKGNISATVTIYESSSTTPTDDTIIFDQDVNETVGTGPWSYAAIQTAFANEQTAHPNAAQWYIVTLTASANPGTHVYPCLVSTHVTDPVWPTDGGGGVTYTHDLSQTNVSGTICAPISAANFVAAGEAPDHLFFYSEGGATTLTITHVKIQVVRG